MMDNHELIKIIKESPTIEYLLDKFQMGLPCGDDLIALDNELRDLLCKLIEAGTYKAQLDRILTHLNNLTGEDGLLCQLKISLCERYPIASLFINKAFK